MLDTAQATWGIAALATLGVIARPWHLPEFIWAIAGAALLVLLNLLPWPDALAAAAKGGNVVVTALTPDTVTEIRIPPLELFVTQKAIMGAVYGFASPRLQIPELLGLYRKGAIKLRELITRTYRLDEINQGYADLDAGKNLRGVVVFDG